MLPKFPKWCPYIRKQEGGVIHIYDPIFKANFYFFLNQSFSRYSKEYMDIFKHFPPHDPDVAGHFSVEELSTGEEIGCIYATDKGGTLMHECLHAVMWILNKRGVPTTQECDEVISYYQEFLVKWATKK